MNEIEKKQLKITAAKVRRHIIEGTFNAKSGHPGGSLSAADIFTYLYFKEMRVDPANPKWTDRDRFVLSKGHCAPGLYGVLAEKGYFSADEIKSLRHIGAMLQGHPDMKGTPGVDMSTGSLGQAFRLPWEWLLPQSLTIRITGFTPFWETERLTKDKFGKPPCSPAIKSWITYAS